ncbi:MAG: MBL fold metallo-hydrolase [Myxococcota bacterium]|jgi:phosphoribosyl 1,2-cyclic phosphodiesterase|nr:MBL fold metallo-hydrolase [Myxococcota bacterium]
MDVARLRVLSSGSAGNGVLVQVGPLRLLFDAGVSALTVRRSLEAFEALGPLLGEESAASNPRDRLRRVPSLDAIFITHEHSDHIRHLATLARRNPDARIFASPGSCRAIRQRMAKNHLSLQTVAPGERVNLGSCTVSPFAVSHDAEECCGYRLEAEHFSFGLATDLGVADADVIAALKGLRVLMLEANHDPQMLRAGPYPEHLKRRILSTQGHLSNEQSARLLSQLLHAGLEHVLLAHLSEENNDPQLAAARLAEALPPGSGVRLEVNARVVPGPIHRYLIRTRRKRSVIAGVQQQLSLPF